MNEFVWSLRTKNPRQIKKTAKITEHVNKLKSADNILNYGHFYTINFAENVTTQFSLQLIAQWQLWIQGYDLM